jgi:hypothetical protein
MAMSERTPPPPDEERIVEDPDLTVPTTGSEGPDTEVTHPDELPVFDDDLDERPEPQEPPD